MSMHGFWLMLQYPIIIDCYGEEGWCKDAALIPGVV